MKHIATIVLAVTALIPVGDAVAAPEIVTTPEAISAPLIALRGADRVGNATPVEPQTPLVEPTVPAESRAAGISVEMKAVLDLVNIERMSRGLVPVRFSAQLNEAALAHTIAQAADGDIYHVDPDDGSSPGDRIALTGYRFSRWGENVAAGHRSPLEVMEAWMLSPGHCQNILNPTFTELGVGYVEGGLVYNRFWTQEFARPQGEAPPPGVYNPGWC